MARMGFRKIKGTFLGVPIRGSLLGVLLSRETTI